MSAAESSSVPRELSEPTNLEVFKTQQRLRFLSHSLDEATPSTELNNSCAFAIDALLRQVEAKGHVPQGLDVFTSAAPIVAPLDIVPGAVFTSGTSTCFPLALTNEQLAAIELATETNYTAKITDETGSPQESLGLLIQLLTQGKRVLVTSANLAPLQQLLENIPEPFAPLVVNTFHTEAGTQLLASLDTLAGAAEAFSLDASTQMAEQLQKQLSQLLAEKEQKLHQHDPKSRVRLPASASDADRARAYHAARAEDLGWVWALSDEEPSGEMPLSLAEFEQWLHEECNAPSPDDREEALQDQPGIDILPDPELVSSYIDCTKETSPLDRVNDPRFKAEAQRAAHILATRETLEDLDFIKSRLDRLVMFYEKLQDAGYELPLTEKDGQEHHYWSDSFDKVHELVEQAKLITKKISLTTRVDLPDVDPASLLPVARKIEEYIAGGGVIRTSTTGEVKLGVMSPKVLKECHSFFEAVEVDGHTPVTLPDVKAVIAHLEANKILDELDAIAGQAAPLKNAAPQYRLHWYEEKLVTTELLDHTGDALREIYQLIEGSGLEASLPQVPEDIANWFLAVKAAHLLIRQSQAHEVLKAHAAEISSATKYVISKTWITAHTGLRDKDARQYSVAYSRLVELDRLRTMLEAHSELENRLNSAAPGLAANIRTELATSQGRLQWKQISHTWVDAWLWAAQQSQFAGDHAAEKEKAQEEISALDEQITVTAQMLAASKAWDTAAGTRMDPRREHALNALLDNVYAKRQRSIAVTDVPDVVKELVPAWVVPLHQVPELFKIQENVFDAVVVLDASRAPLGSMFVFYLAPQVIVAGEPTPAKKLPVTNLQDQKLKELADLYLKDDTEKALWSDPSRSLFDEVHWRLA